MVYLVVGLAAMLVFTSVVLFGLAVIIAVIVETVQSARRRRGAQRDEDTAA